MLKPTESPPASRQPRFVASMRPGPPPVTTAKPVSASSRPVLRAMSYSGPLGIRAEPNTATAGRSICATASSPARNSSATKRTSRSISPARRSSRRRSSTSSGEPDEHPTATGDPAPAWLPDRDVVAEHVHAGRIGPADTDRAEREVAAGGLARRRARARIEQDALGRDQLQAAGDAQRAGPGDPILDAVLGVAAAHDRRRHGGPARADQPERGDREPRLGRCGGRKRARERERRNEACADHAGSPTATGSGGASARGGGAGRRSVNAAPSPRTLSTSIEPLMSSASRWTIASPRPEPPPSSRLREGSAR